MDAGLWIPKLLATQGPAVRTLWLMHEPPKGTRVCTPGTLAEGPLQWTEAITRFHPLLVICGHDHDTPVQTGIWHDRVGTSHCVNVGQSNDGPLRYCVVEATFSFPQPALPKRMVVTAYPKEEGFVIEVE
jgi:Icc-related predicted phosphoesterase